MTNSKKTNLEPGRKVDIRVLEAIARLGEVHIIVYFEEELAKNSSYLIDLQKFKGYPKDECPFIEILAFLSFQRKMSPYFNDALTSIPLMVTIISTDEIFEGKPVIKGVLPFLDEMDFN
jgi:hypothetical protein